MVQVGDELVKLHAYQVAMLQCYRRFVVTMYKADPYQVDSDADAYMDTFFPCDQSKKDSILAARALIVSSKT